MSQPWGSSDIELANKLVLWIRSTHGSFFIALGIVVISIFLTFSTGYDSDRGFLGSIPHMNLLITEGKWTHTNFLSPWEYTGLYIPTRFGIVFGVILIVFGMFVRSSSNRQTSDIEK